MNTNPRIAMSTIDQHKKMLVVALVSPLGIESNDIYIKIKQAFSKYSFKSHHIKISGILTDLIRDKIIQDGPTSINEKSENERISTLMDAGDKMRVNSTNKGVLAALSIGKISDVFERSVEDKNVFIIDSIKNPGEIQVLSDLFGPAFFSIGFFLPRDKRITNLSDRIRRKSGKPINADEIKSAAEDLIRRDESGGNDGFGQEVRDAFALADAFVDLEDPNFVSGQIERIFDLWFRSPYITPTRAEFGMFLAYGASLKSADLSRQVGAAIINSEGEVLALGFNEVPKPGGGAYWEGDVVDRRDFRLGKDYNATTRFDIFKEIADVLFESEIINQSKFDTSEKLASQLVSGAVSKKIKSTRVANLIEFGRIVHAEMCAITETARRGVSIKGATLVCTTFPCHMCARHIIASGIKSVIYIEPYPKSLTSQMYEGMVVLDDGDRKPSVDKLLFQPFIGISPKRYIDFFKMPKRKDDYGNTVKWDPSVAIPLFPQFQSQHFNLILLDKIITLKTEIQDNPNFYGLTHVPLPENVSTVTSRNRSPRPKPAPHLKKRRKG